MTLYVCRYFDNCKVTSVKFSIIIAATKTRRPSDALQHGDEGGREFRFRIPAIVLTSETET